MRHQHEYMSRRCRGHHAPLAAYEAEHGTWSRGRSFLARHLPLLAAQGHIDAAGDELGLDQTLDQIVLGAVLHRSKREMVVVQASQHYDRDTPGAIPHLQKSLVSGTVGKVEVDQNKLGRILWDEAQPGS